MSNSEPAKRAGFQNGHKMATIWHSAGSTDGFGLISSRLAIAGIDPESVVLPLRQFRGGGHQITVAPATELPQSSKSQIGCRGQHLDEWGSAWVLLRSGN